MDLAALLESHPAPAPPIFVGGHLPREFWEGRFGCVHGATAWRRLAAATPGKSRTRPAIDDDSWREILRAEELRRARRWHRISRQEAPGIFRADREQCARSLWAWLYEYAWIEDPHAAAGQRVLPFVPWPAQAALIPWLMGGAEARTGEIRLLNKGRNLGASWVGCLLLLHRWLFEPRFLALVGSTTIDEADDGTTQSIMGKIRFALDRLPAHLHPDFPPHYERKEDAVGDTFARLRNHDNDSVIRARAMTRRFGRGGRVNVLWRDEAAHVHPTIQQGVRTAIESLAGVEWVTSTPNGPGDDFHARWRSLADERKAELSWTADPRRDDAWFEGLLQEHGGLLTWDQREQEHRCSFAGVSGPRIWHPPEESVLCYRPEDLDAETRRVAPCVGGMDFGSGPSPTVYTELLLDWSDVEEHPDFGRTPMMFADACVPRWRAEPHEIAADVLAAREGKQGSWSVYGDPAGRAVDVTQGSWESSLNACGLPLVCLAHQPFAEHHFILRAIRFVDWMLQRGRLRIRSDLDPVIGAVQTWQWDIPRGLALELVNRAWIGWRKDQPSHFCESLWYGAVAVVMYHQPRGRPESDRAVPQGMGEELEGVL